MEAKAILDLEDENIEKAVFQPNTPKMARKIFDIMISSVDSCYIIAGMDGTVISIDQDKMERMAERRAIDLARYETPVRQFISSYLNKISKKD